MQIDCDKLRYRYPAAEKPLFETLSLRITGPGFHALFGPSGVGKTSFARILTGDLTPDSGEIRRRAIERLAYTYNTERLPGWATVARHLENTIPADQTAAKAALIESFGLEPCLDQRFSQLSLGQKNRINLLRYLLQGFEMLILDESLANVDEPTRERIILKIKERFPETMFLYISHNAVEVAKFCDQIVVFRGSRKSPPVRLIAGRNLTVDQEAEPAALERTMLEIMHAL